MFFTLSKIFWMLAMPLNALCLLGLIGLILQRWKENAGNVVLAVTVSCLIVFGLLPVGPFIVSWMEGRYPVPQALPAKVDGIIVLGGMFEPHLGHERGQASLNDSAERLFAFRDLAKKYPQAVKIFSGGSGDIAHPDDREATDAKKFLDDMGLPGAPVLFESNSRNTYENAVYSKELAKPKAGQTWILVTSGFHMPRSVGIFEKQGWSVIPYPCDFKTDGQNGFWHEAPNVTYNFYMLNIAVKELVGDVAYYISGKTAFILPPRASL